MKASNLKILIIFLIFTAFNIMACSKPEEKHLSFEDLNTINDSYNNYFNSFNERVIELESSETVKNDIENRQIPNLEDFTNIQVFDPQGNSFDSKLTIRDTIPYQRLMGHMNFYSFLEVIENKAYLSSVITIYNFNNPDPFRGILKVSKPLDDFFEDNQYDLDYYLLDSMGTFIRSNGTVVELNNEDQDEISELLKDISSLQEKSGTIELNLDGKVQTLNYVIKNGIGIFS